MIKVMNGTAETGREPEVESLAASVVTELRKLDVIGALGAISMICAIVYAGYWAIVGLLLMGR